MTEPRVADPRPVLPDGLVAVVKRDCPTCVLVVPVLAELVAAGHAVAVYTQDDAGFPAGLDPRHDADLAVSWHWGIDTVPTLLRVVGGAEAGRAEGWSRPAWEALSGREGLGRDLPEHRPGCGSLSVDPDRVDGLRARFAAGALASRRVELAAAQDEAEALFARGWTDGLPVVAPTPERVLRMLTGTSRRPDEVVAVVPPDLVAVTVEKVAVNAVMAGCAPEHLPFVLAAVATACTDRFNMHGLLCTLWASGPVVIVNGPLGRAVGVNAGYNALGQGCRANATIGRALQLVVRNVGGGRPGADGIDRSTFGAPGKYTCCFAENEAGLPAAWRPLSVEAGHATGDDVVTLFAGHGPCGLPDATARTPEALVATYAAHLRLRVGSAVGGLGTGRMDNQCVVVSPEHARVLAGAGWGKDDLRGALHRAVFGAEPAAVRWDDPLVVFAGGEAGPYSVLLEGWVAGPRGSQATTGAVAPWR